MYSPAFFGGGALSGERGLGVDYPAEGYVKKVLNIAFVEFLVRSRKHHNKTSLDITILNANTFYGIKRKRSTKQALYIQKKLFTNL